MPGGENDKPLTELPELNVEVVWDDVRNVDADVHVVGHYQGVLPQYAERVLDEAVSGVKPDPEKDPDDARQHLIITELTRRGVIRGTLGDVMFIPWGRERVVLVAGMGVPGSFRMTELRRLVAGAASTVGRLLDRPVIATVLIGAGAGNLGVPQCVGGLIDGLHDAFESYPQLRMRRLRIVERNLDRALEIHSHLMEHAGKSTRGVKLNVEPMVEGTGGVIPSQFRFSMLLAAVARSGLPEDSPTRAIFAELVGDLKQRGKAEVDELQKDLRAELLKHKELRQLALRSFPITPAASTTAALDSRVPTRLVFAVEGSRVRASAITNTVTVTEREVPITPGLLQEGMQRLAHPDDPSNPNPEAVHRLGRYVFTLLVPPDLEDRFCDDPIARVLEVDQTMAGLPWEMLVAPRGQEKPLGVAAPVARQLRTTYSPRPEDDRGRRIARALVIGDPGDGHAAMEGARIEAEAVGKVLKQHGIDVTLRIGPADTLDSLPAGAQPAAFFDTLVLLLQDEFDLVHYCGHAIFTPQQPDAIGWVFAGGEILAAKYLEQMRRPPLLVFANACNTAQLTGQITPPGARGQTAARKGRGKVPTLAKAPADPRFVAGLADEFFRRGIRDYIGTAAEVPSGPAAEFATNFYTALFGTKSTIGQAVRSAREELYKKNNTYGAAWGLYQHYGDPLRRMS